MREASNLPVFEKKTARKIPEYLVWEVLDGQPLYRRGYKNVLRKLKTWEEIRVTSNYQSLIKGKSDLGFDKYQKSHDCNA